MERLADDNKKKAGAATPAGDRAKSETEIDLLELFGYFRRRLAYIVLCFLIGGVAAGCTAYFLVTPKYKASAKLYMVSASSDSIVNLTDLNLGTSLSSDYAELLVTRPVLESVIEELRLEDYLCTDLERMLDIATVGDTRILKITVTSTDPQEARDIANCLADKGMEYLPDVMETAEPNLAEEAVVPEKKSSPSTILWTAAGALGCMFVCLGVFTVLFMLDDTLKTSDDVEKFLGIMPLAVVPENSSGGKKRERKWKKRGRSVV